MRVPLSSQFFIHLVNIISGQICLYTGFDVCWQGEAFVFRRSKRLQAKCCQLEVVILPGHEQVPYM